MNNDRYELPNLLRARAESRSSGVTAPITVATAMAAIAAWTPCPRRSLMLSSPPGPGKPTSLAQHCRETQLGKA